MTRTPQRVQFLTDVLTTAIENFGCGWFYVLDYEPNADSPGGPCAVVQAMDDGRTHRIDPDVIAAGLAVIRTAEMWPSLVGPDARVLHNPRTGERLFMALGRHCDIRLADRTNGDDGDLDVIDALAIVECGLFGQVVYA